MVCFVLVLGFISGVWTDLRLDANYLVRSCYFTASSFDPSMTATETSAETGNGETLLVLVARCQLPRVWEWRVKLRVGLRLVLGVSMSSSSSSSSSSTFSPSNAAGSMYLQPRSQGCCLSSCGLLCFFLGLRRCM